MVMKGGGRWNQCVLSSLPSIENYLQKLTPNNVKLETITQFINSLNPTPDDEKCIKYKISNFNNKLIIYDKIPKLYKIYNMYKLLTNIPISQRGNTINLLDNIRPVYFMFFMNVNANRYLTQVEKSMLEDLPI
jgi:hypothetical protein